MNLRRPDIDEMTTTAVVAGEPEDGYLPLTLGTNRGPVALRYYNVTLPRAAVICAGGGWDTPARGLYPRLCVALAALGVAGLRVRFRDPRDLAESARDVLAAARFLAGAGYTDLGLVGHSFGGAVVVQAAAALDVARAVVTLATQSHGADAGALPPGCALLAVHGTADEVLPPVCSRSVYDRARPPRRLQLCRDAGHSLDEAADEVYALTRDWLVGHLARAERPSAEPLAL